MSDYTPGHAYEDIAAIAAPADLDHMNACLVRLYKAGQANERAAIVAGVRGYATREWWHYQEYRDRLDNLADLIAGGEL